MSIKSFIKSRIIRTLCGEPRLMRQRFKAERKRKMSGLSHHLEYFHQVDDPYSHLMVQALMQLRDKYDIHIIPNIVSAPNKDNAPELEQLNQYALLDAKRLAVKSSFSFPDNAIRPKVGTINDTQALLVNAINKGVFFDRAMQIGHNLWAGKKQSVGFGRSPVGELVELGNLKREDLGHYLGATVYYAGEWYWGVDRLHYLEERLQDLGALRKDATPDYAYAAPVDISNAPNAMDTCSKGPGLDFFFSFRSPYSYLAFQRTCDLADAYDVKLKLRFVLPMMMRGLPVPGAKRMYILGDAAREARRMNIDFGLIADPLGKPVLRGYSILPWAIEQGRGREYCQSFMHSVWSQGVDAGTDRGLRKIVTQAGLSWNGAFEHLGSDDWVSIEQQNRDALTDLQLWGVPSYHIGSKAIWGQDRLWLVEKALITQANAISEMHQG